MDSQRAWLAAFPRAKFMFTRVQVPSTAHPYSQLEEFHPLAAQQFHAGLATDPRPSGRALLLL